MLPRRRGESVRKTALFFFRLKSVIRQYLNLPVKSNVIGMRRHISSGVGRPRSNPEDVDDEGN